MPSEEQGCLVPGGQAPAAARVRTSCGSDAPPPGDLPEPLLSCEGQEGRVAERPGPATPQPCDWGQALTPPGGKEKTVGRGRWVREHAGATLPASCIRLCPQTPGKWSLQDSSGDMRPGGAGAFPAHVCPLWRTEGRRVTKRGVTALRAPGLRQKPLRLAPGAHTSQPPPSSYGFLGEPAE